MNALFGFLCSLLLTSVFSFAAPTLLLCTLVLSLSLFCYIPLLEAVCLEGRGQIFTFLATFGSGQPLEGILVIGCTCGLVGALFDAYVLSQQQTPGRNE